MGWADYHIKHLTEGKMIQFRPRGNSMVPFIKSGDLVTVEPIKPETEMYLKEGDIVLCVVGRNQYLHLIGKFIWGGDDADDKYRIENASGFVNGVIGRDKIFGRVVNIQL